MNLKIEIDIENKKTWAEKCGGNIKTVIHYHLGRLKNDLKTYTDSTMESSWYGEHSSNCKKCVFNINNENDYIEHLKANTAILEECAFNNTSISDLADGIHHNNCRHYKPCSKFEEKFSYEEMKKLQKEMSDAQVLKSQIKEILTSKEFCPVCGCILNNSTEHKENCVIGKVIKIVE